LSSVYVRSLRREERGPRQANQKDEQSH
jgi:hypothetical protein